MDKCRPFFQALKKNGVDFRWYEECETAFQGLKRYLTSPPLLSKPSSEETLYLYLTVPESASSEALVREDEGIQKLVYYVSHSKNRPQTRYQRLEKLVLALFIISRKIKHYFQTVTITVLAEHPLRSVVENPKAIGRISKCASELKSYGLRYEPGTVIKG